MSYRSEGPGIEYAGFRFGLFDKYQGGEIEIKTPEEVEEALKNCSWILFHIERYHLDTTIRAENENARTLKRGKKITLSEVKEFMENDEFKKINPKSYFNWVEKDKVLPTVREWEKIIIEKERELIEGKISFKIFLIILNSFHRSVDELGFDKYSYLSRELETLKIFKKQGYYPSKKDVFSQRQLRFFKRK